LKGRIASRRRRHFHKLKAERSRKFFQSLSDIASTDDDQGRLRHDGINKNIRSALARTMAGVQLNAIQMSTPRLKFG